MRREDTAGASPPAEPAYDVGYGRPPKHSQFKRGQSGNPRGRTKGQLNTQTYLDKILNQKVVVNEQGRSRTITKREVILTQLVNRAAGKGDLATIKHLHHIELSQEREQRRAANSVPRPSPATGPTPEDCNIDFDAMTTDELRKVQEAAEIMQTYSRDAPGQPDEIPMPPNGPERSRREK
jgi:hypothetical protein